MLRLRYQHPTLALRALPLALLALVALLAAAPSPARAQQVSGVVRDSVSGLAVAGAVVSVLDASGATTSRAITSQSGRFLLDIPAAPTKASLWVIRLGFRPRTVALGDTPAERARPVEIRLQSLPALLTSVQVSDRSICPGSEDRSGALNLWEQARAGLLAAVVVRQTRPATMDVLAYTTDEDPNSRLVVRQRTSRLNGTTGRPFVAVEQAAGFARQGYMHRDSTGSLTFFAPDADVLLDEDFARTHCFRVTRDADSHPGQVGLAFEPAPGRRPDGFVDVRGTLWLESAHPALHSLEFAFTGLEKPYLDAGTGGTLTFRTMPDGMVYIDQWSLLLPSIQARAQSQSRLDGAGGDAFLPTSKRLTDARVTQIREVGGTVLSAEWPDGTRATTPTGSVTGLVRDRDAHPVAGAEVRLDGSNTAARTDSTGRFVLTPVVPGRYGLEVVDSTYAPFMDPRQATSTITVGRETLTVPPIEVPDRRAAVAKLCGSSPALGADNVAVLGVVVGPTGPFGSGVVVQASYALTAFRNPHSARADSNATTPGSDGRFVVCDVPRTRRLYLRLVRGDSVLGDTAFSVNQPVAQRVDWTVTRGRPRPAAMGTVAGYVRVDTTAAPLANAMVEIGALDRSTMTNPDGSFTLAQLPEGRYGLDVHRLGFTVLRDSVTVAGGETARRIYQMQRRSTAPDTVRVAIADTTALISSRLRDFETRARKKISGYFITSDQLRADGDQSLITILHRRIPGTQEAVYWGLEMLEASRGTDTFQKLPYAIPGDTLSPRGCWITLYIDGVRIFMSDGGQPAPDIGKYSTADFDGVEFYPGGSTMPPIFNTTVANDCGVLALWRREN